MKRLVLIWILIAQLVYAQPMSDFLIPEGGDINSEFFSYNSEERHIVNGVLETIKSAQEKLKLEIHVQGSLHMNIGVINFWKDYTGPSFDSTNTKLEKLKHKVMSIQNFHGTKRTEFGMYIQELINNGTGEIIDEVAQRKNFLSLNIKSKLTEKLNIKIGASSGALEASARQIENVILILRNVQSDLARFITLRFEVDLRKTYAISAYLGDHCAKSFFGDMPLFNISPYEMCSAKSIDIEVNRIQSISIGGKCFEKIVQSEFSACNAFKTETGLKNIIAFFSDDCSYLMQALINENTTCSKFNNMISASNAKSVLVNNSCVKLETEMSLYDLCKRNKNMNWDGL